MNQKDKFCTVHQAIRLIELGVDIEREYNLINNGKKWILVNKDELQSIEGFVRNNLPIFTSKELEHLLGGNLDVFDKPKKSKLQTNVTYKEEFTNVVKTENVWANSHQLLEGKFYETYGEALAAYVIQLIDKNIGILPKGIQSSCDEGVVIKTKNKLNKHIKNE